MTTDQLNKPKFSGKMTPAQVIQAIDHTKLTFKPGEDETASIQKLCKEAVDNGFFAVCVRPRHIGLAKKEVNGSAVKVATVIGFPPDKVDRDKELTTATVGNFTTAHKLDEVKNALADGVDELDLVINVGQFKQEAKGATQPNTLAELKAVQAASNGRPVKVIIETDLLNDDEIAKATRLCNAAGVFMVKTCTGMVNGGEGATVHKVDLIRKTLDQLGGTQEIKASGGIKDLAKAQALSEVGADRFGTSSGVEIKQGVTGTQSY